MNFDPSRVPSPVTGRPYTAPGSGPLRTPGLLGLLVRLVLVPVAFVFMLLALVAGTLLALGLVGWALLRGRRPAPGLFKAYYHRARERNRPGQGRAQAGNDRFVVDVEAVEVPQEPSAPPRR